jgi:glycosyltransferase involved in cell wall biosynthesis
MGSPLSVAIVTLNEEDRIGRCVESVSFADEILVLDSGSRDRTVAIAESHGCRVLFHPWMGYARQKQHAVDQCRNDWVLILDSDERVSKEAAGILPEILGKPEQYYAGYNFLRKNFFHGRWVRHCGWWPIRVMWLVDRRRGRFSDDLVHERWIPEGPVSPLDAVIEHYSFRNYADLIVKMQTYSTLAAQEMFLKGRTAHWWSPLSHGGWMFVRTYFLEKGLLEGFDGFMISLLNAGGSFMKYAKLREAGLHGENLICDPNGSIALKEPSDGARTETRQK